MEKQLILGKLNSIIGQGPDKKSYLGQDDFVEVRHRNIRLSFHVKNKLINLAKLLGTIRRIMEKMSSVLGIDFDQVEIEIFQNKEEWIEKHTIINDQETPSWVQGDTGRVIRLVMEQNEISSFEKLQLIVTHECVHLAVRNFTDGKAPAWLDEGLAVYFSQNLPDEYKNTLENAFKNGAQLPLEMLNDPFSRLDRTMKSLAYSQSYSLVNHLVQKHGWNVIKELLASSARGESINAALRTWGLNLYLLEKEWEQDFCRYGK